MNNETLFGHLASRFVPQTENLATEALNYVLSRSDDARQSLLDLLADAGIRIDEPVIFATQVKEDQHVYDLVGRNPSGENRIILEAKFWAGLTVNQPDSYLGSLPEGKTSILLFVAPFLRFDTLWPELQRRCSLSGFPPGKARKTGKEFLIAGINDHHTIGLISWRVLLSRIKNELEAAAQHSLVNDIQQLEGLCNQQDTEAFLPLQPEELSSLNGSRIYEFCGIVDSAIEKLKVRKVCHTDGLRSAGGYGYYGRYFALPGFGCFLSFYAEMWRDFRETPIWMTVKASNNNSWSYSKNVRHLLRSLEFETPPRLFDYENDAAYVPIFLPTGKEYDTVVDAVVDQVEEVYRLLCFPEGEDS